MKFRRKEGNVKKDTITLEEAKTSSQNILDALFKARSQLRHIVAKYETTLQNRWIKKSPKQRTEILLQAWPKMSRVHRPDYDLLRKERKTKGYHQRDLIATDMALRFPSMNTEDLSLAKPLLLMLESRSRSFPYVFLGLDLDAIQVGISSNMLVPKYIRGYDMYLNGESREDYGRLVCWTKDQQACSKRHEGIALDPGMGIFILENQRDILEFLVAGLNWLPVNSSSDTWIPQRAPKLERKTSSALANGHESVTVRTFEALYRSPDACDFARLRSFVEAHCNEVADHFLLIREDTGYFAELMREAYSHTGEATVNRRYYLYSTQLSNKSWNEALSQVLITAYHDAFLWRSIAQLLDQLIATYAEQRTNIRHRQLLPDAYVEALHCLNHILNIIPGRHLACLPSYIAVVPSFKPYISVTAKISGRLLAAMTRYSADNLYWLFSELASTADDRPVCALQDLSLEIEYLISKDVQQRRRLDRRLITAISDLALTAEIQQQLILSSCNEAFLLPSQEEIDKWAYTLIEPLREIRDTINDNIFSAQLNDYTPLVTDLRVFEYPSDKPCTATNVAKMRRAEHALDILWQKVDKRSVHRTGKTLEELGQGRIQHRDIQRTPPWIDQQQSPRERNGKDKSAEELDVSLALSTLVERTESTIDPTQPSAVREKVKTRGLIIDHAQTKDLTAMLAADQGRPSADVPLRLPVRKKAFNTFATLFGKPLLADRTPGELPWTDLKKAMVNVGFGAEKLQGSAWLFESEYGSIIFHEPHPQSKLPMQWARRIARRLHRNFGWTAETFVLEVGMENDNVSSNIP
ncbi:MAG: hypothetical protein Q9205_002129 [Flavoplaca limonia]